MPDPIPPTVPGVVQGLVPPLTGVTVAGVTLAAGAALVAGAAWAGREIYRRYTRLPKYSFDELARHKKLVTYYQDVLHKTAPEVWTLDNGRPTVSYNFKIESDDLVSQIKRLNITEANIDQASRGILNVIAQLFTSLDHRYLGTMKGSSIEGFFFVDLAKMVSERFTKMRFNIPEDLAELQRILKYCDLVFRDVLRADVKLLRLVSFTPDNNSLGGLDEMMGNLKGIIASSVELNHEVTFNSYVEQLDNAISSMAAETFHIMYLLTKGNQGDAPNFPVIPFLEQGQTRFPELETYKKQKLALWLNKTLLAAGITCADFKNTVTPTLAATDRHLEGESILDHDCSLPEELFNPKHADWGHWPFSIGAQVTDDAVTRRIHTIREIHQDILKLYHLRRLLKNVRKIAPTSGESWLYGDETGLKIVETLMLSAQTLTERLGLKLSEFMKEYTAIFNRAKTSGHITIPVGVVVTNAIHHYAGGTDTEYGFTDYYERAKNTIKAITTHCEGYQARRANTEQSKRQLLEDLIEFLRYSGKAGEDYHQLQIALLGLPSHAQITASTAADEATTAQASATLALQLSMTAAEDAARLVAKAEAAAIAADRAGTELAKSKIAKITAKTAFEALDPIVGELTAARLAEADAFSHLNVAKEKVIKAKHASDSARHHTETALLEFKKTSEIKSKSWFCGSMEDKEVQMAAAQEKYKRSLITNRTKADEEERAKEVVESAKKAHAAAVARTASAVIEAAAASEAKKASREVYHMAMETEAIAAALAEPLMEEKEALATKAEIATKKALDAKVVATLKQEAATIAAKKATKAAEVAKAVADATAKAIAQSQSVLDRKVKLESLPSFHVAQALFDEATQDTLSISTRRSLNFDDTLPQHSKPYSPKLHEDIFQHFLKANHRYMKPGFAIFWKPAADMEFQKLYKNVNALMKYLYPDGKPRPFPPGVGAEDQALDNLLINQMLNSLMSDYYTKYHKEACFSECRRARINAPLLHLDNKDGTITIKLNSNLVPYAESCVSASYEELKKEHAVIIAERDAALTELAEAKITIASNEAALASKEAALASSEAALASKEAELEILVEERASFSGGLEQVEAAILQLAAKEAEIVRLKQELKEAQEKTARVGPLPKAGVGSNDSTFFGGSRRHSETPPVHPAAGVWPR